MSDFIFCFLCGCMTEQRVEEDLFAIYWYCAKCGRLCDHEYKDDE